MELDTTGCGRYFGSLSKKQRVLPSFDPAFYGFYPLKKSLARADGSGP